MYSATIFVRGHCRGAGIARIAVVEIAVMGDEDRPVLPELDPLDPDHAHGAARIGQHVRGQDGFLHRVDRRDEGLRAVRAAGDVEQPALLGQVIVARIEVDREIHAHGRIAIGADLLDRGIARRRDMTQIASPSFGNGERADIIARA
jgi:hypothetical protein